MDCEMENEYDAHCDINSTHCYLNLPTDMEEDNPLDIENIKEKQDQDDVLQHNLFQFPAQCAHTAIAGNQPYPKGLTQLHE